MPHYICHTLTQTAIDQIRLLHAACQDQVPGPALLGLLLPEADVKEEDTFYALHYMEETLVSFLSCFCPDGKTCEISGFTAPAFRNRGFYSRLLRAAKKEAGRLFGTAVFQFQCLASDPDTAAFCKAHGLVFSHSECIMKRKPPFPSLCALPSAVRLCPSTERKTLAKLHESAFGCPASFSINYVDTVLADPDTVSILILTDGKTVGLMHLTFFKAPDGQTAEQRGQTVYLMGLGILPAFRRRGFAEAALRTVFSRLPEGSELALQVSTLNAAAFRLYEKLAFEAASRLDYYTSSRLNGS